MILGTIFGSFGGAIQTGKLGRRYSLMIDSCTFLVSTLMLAFSPNFQMVLAARFFQGLFDLEFRYSRMPTWELTKWFPLHTSKALDYLFLLGYAVGSGRVAIPIYTSEICQPEVRKYTGAFAMIFMLSGLLSAAILGKEHNLKLRFTKSNLSLINLMNFFVLDHPMYIKGLGLTLEASYSVPIFNVWNNKFESFQVPVWNGE